MVRGGVPTLFFYMWKSSCLSTSVEEKILSPLNGLGSLDKNQLTFGHRCMNFLLQSQFYPAGLFVFLYALDDFLICWIKKH
jgi:hypothetical protein